MSSEPPRWAREQLADARVGHLATADARGSPHVVPVCFVLLGERIITPIDEKPKSGRRLGRLRNIASTGRAALVVDHYDEDWQRLAWVLVRGEALITPGGSAVDEVAVDALREKYPQYRTMALEQCDLIEVRIERWSWWRWS